MRLLAHHNSTKHEKLISVFYLFLWVTTGLFLAHLWRAEITNTEANMPDTCN